MKNILIIFGFFCLAPAYSQLRSELNLPRAGDELLKEQVVYCKPGEAGEKQTWDFSSLRLIDDAYTVNYFTRDDWKIIGAEKGKLSFFRIDGDSLLLAGYENPTTLVRYQQPGLLIRFPLVYGESFKGNFSGRGKHHDLLESIITGEIHTTADATGMIIFPGRDTLENITRVHIRKIETSRYIPISSGFTVDTKANETLFSDNKPDVIITDTYQWYEEGYRYPVFETIEAYLSNNEKQILISSETYLFHPADQVLLPEDAENQAIRKRQEDERRGKMLEQEDNLLSFRCYPNPVKDQLTIELNFRRPVAIDAVLWDMYGRFLKYFPSRSQDVQYKETIDVWSIPPGYYVVKVFAGNEVYSEKVVKN